MIITRELKVRLMAIAILAPAEALITTRELQIKLLVVDCRHIGSYVSFDN